MADRFIRDPMTLDEERRALTTAPDASPHLHFVRAFTPGTHRRPASQQAGVSPLFGSPGLDGLAGAVLSNDCDHER